MNAKQSNKLAAYTAVEAVLQATPEIANVPGLPGKLAVLRARLDEINHLGATQTQPIRASMAERDLALDTMADTAVEIAGLITSLARDSKTPQLAEAVEVGRSAFRRSRRSHRVWFAQRVLDTARGVASQLEHYGVTTETLAAFAARIEVAGTGVSLPRGTVVEKKAATRQLAGLFTEIDELLDDQIDRMVFRLRKTHPAFDARYGGARSIINRPGSRNRTAAESQGSTIPVVPPAPATTLSSPDVKAA